MYSQFGYIMIYVTDMKRSVAFYRDVMGFALKFESEFWSEFNVGEVTFALHHSTPDQVIGKRSMRFGFYTNDIDGDVAALEAKGAQVGYRAEEDYGFMAGITDPDGYDVQLFQAKHG